MFKNYIKIYLRNIMRHKGYSLINLAGLTVGFICFILVLLYVKYEFDFDKQHSSGDRIFRINVTQKHPNREFTTYASMAPLGPAAKVEIPEVEDFTRLFGTGKILVKFENESFYENNAVFTDPGIFTMFNVPLKMGNPETALNDKFSVVITEDIANKYFQSENPIGRLIQIEGDKNYKITAVCENFPENTTINPDLMISFSTLEDLAGDDFMQNWITTNMTTYIMAAGKDLENIIEPKINLVMNNHSKAEVERSLHLEKFSRLYLYSELSGSGKIKYIYIFLTIGFLILLIACINFMNLSTARSVNRAKEVGLRKVVGASRNQLISQFFGESLIMSLLSLAVAILIVANILPVFEHITNLTIQLPGIADLYLYLLLVFIGIAVGIFAGSYPAKNAL